MGAGKLVRVDGKMNRAKYGNTWNTLKFVVVTSQNVERFKWYKCFLRLCICVAFILKLLLSKWKVGYLNFVCLVMCNLHLSFLL